ncbi:hypothetical protein H9P43_005391 [Blastocladiella emersonii ATCC 22665]|nr:hypothetical protein H9P43_005391 [Blastocladiella emersonii ATCC 22665]
MNSSPHATHSADALEGPGGFKAPSIGRPAASKPDEPRAPPPLPYTPPEWSAAPSTQWSLEVLKGGLIIETLPLPAKPVATVGWLESCDLVLAHGSISRYHAVLQFSRANELFLYDLSTNGTSLNKTLVKPRTHVQVRDGDLIRFGSSTRLFIVHGPPEPEPEAADPAETPAPIPADEPTGISWGFGADADDDTLPGTRTDVDLDAIEPDLGAYYAKDPRKTLTAWLDQRGLDLHIDHAESGAGHAREYTARLDVSLDADGDPRTVTGLAAASRKRDAERNAILLVLAKIDALGYLRESPRGNNAARVRRLMGEEDGGDGSDGDDEFFDRAATTAKQTAAPAAGPAVENLDSLTAKRTALLADRARVDSELAGLTDVAAAGGEGEEEDELDAYMAGLDKAQRADQRAAKLKELAAIDAEIARVDKLLAIVRPAAPPKPAPAPAQAKPALKRPASPAKNTADVEPPSAKRPRVAGPARPPPAPAAPAAPAAAAPRRPVAPPPRSAFRDMGMDVEAEVDSDSETAPSAAEKVVEWVPPAGQTGDGRTSLNAKFGY